jgi:hypothetical protein
MLDYCDQGKNERREQDKADDKYRNAYPLKDGAHGGSFRAVLRSVVRGVLVHSPGALPL